MFKKVGISVAIVLLIYCFVHYPLFGSLHGPSYGFGVLVISMYQLVSMAVDYYEKKKERI